MNHTRDTAFEVHWFIHHHLDTASTKVNVPTDTLPTFDYPAPNTHAPEIHLAHTQRVHVPLELEKGPNRINSVLDAKSTALPPLPGEVS